VFPFSEGKCFKRNLRRRRVGRMVICFAYKEDGASAGNSLGNGSVPADAEF
jgi:hypothetical protein